MRRKPTGKTLTTRVAPRFCPKCFYLLDAATSLLGEVQPMPGDFTVCIGCACVLRFTPTMHLELSSLEAIPTHSRMDFARVVQAVKARGREDG